MRERAKFSMSMHSQKTWARGMQGVKQTHILMVSKKESETKDQHMLAWSYFQYHLNVSAIILTYVFSPMDNTETYGLITSLVIESSHRVQKTYWALFFQLSHKLFLKAWHKFSEHMKDMTVRHNNAWKIEVYLEVYLK